MRQMSVKEAGGTLFTMFTNSKKKLELFLAETNAAKKIIKGDAS